jgi:hypothetical protein
MDALKRIQEECDINENIDIHWKDYIRCVDIYNYRTIRELIPERCGTCINGKKFMILYDDPHRFYPVPKWYLNSNSELNSNSYECTNFEDEVHKDFAKMKFAQENNYHVLRISFEESNSIEYWIRVFIDQVMTSEYQKFVCSNTKKYDKLQKNSEYYLREERKLYFY